MTDLRRNLTEKVNKYLEIFPIVALLGVRQCGKTTLARLLRPDWKYFDLEKSSDYNFITGDIEFFLKEYPHHIVIDEAQQSSQLFRELRGIIEVTPMKMNELYEKPLSPFYRIVQEGIDKNCLEKLLELDIHFSYDMVVNKFLYGVKIPYWNKIIIPFKEPRREDIIVFKFPQDPHKDFINRVIGVAGDVVESRNKQLYLNHKPVN
ncbi:MAG: signal peptidase I, partial [Candidatus Pacearchaeota archaeon]|nr:signal peptidase I [Candidatus Pacearchaeota archaeon]